MVLSKKNIAGLLFTAFMVSSCTSTPSKSPDFIPKTPEASDSVTPQTVPKGCFLLRQRIICPK